MDNLMKKQLPVIYLLSKLKNIFIHKQLCSVLLCFCIAYNAKAQTFTNATKITKASVTGAVRTANDKFGQNVAIGGDKMAVYSLTGVYIYHFEDNSWKYQYNIEKPASLAADQPDSFGSRSIIGNTMIFSESGEYLLVYGKNAAYYHVWYIYKLDHTDNKYKYSSEITSTSNTDSPSISVGISGDIIVTGVYKANTIRQADVYQLNSSTQVWEHRATLTKSSNEGNAEGYGSSLAIYGDYFCVGAYGSVYDESGTGSAGMLGSGSSKSGAVYLYKFNRDDADNPVTLLKKITPTYRYKGDQFGYSLSMYQNTILVGDNTNGYAYGTSSSDLSARNASAGAAYVFTINTEDNTVAELQKIMATDRNGADNFGDRVAIDGNYLVVGAGKEDEDEDGANTINAAGSAYIFEYNETSGLWQHKQKIIAPDRQVNDNFGNEALALSGDHIAVGVANQDYDEDGANPLDEAGAVYTLSVSNPTFNPTPVSLTDYTAKANGNNALLQWVTASESNNSHFIIERSTDEQTFSLLATVNAKGEQGGNYAYTDTNPYAGTNYYRLSQQDYDGTTVVLGIQAVEFGINGAKKAVNIYPNPVKGTSFFVQAQKEGEAVISISGISGETLLKQQVIFSNNTAEITLPAPLKQGIYILNVEGAGSQKLIIQ